MPDTEEQHTEEAAERRSPTGKTVYEAVLGEGENELQRPSSALFWSGLAAGLAMGFSLIAEGLLTHLVPKTEWAPLFTKLGYSVGFLVVILGRQQLFTENTLTPILPLLKHKTADTFLNVLRLWGIIFAANMLGALLIAWVLASTDCFTPEVREAFFTIGKEALGHPFLTTFGRAVFAGWLIALIVWMLPYAESAHIWIIIFLTYLIGLGHFGHVIVGAVEMATLAFAHQAPWSTVLTTNLLPTLLGNITGGVLLVAALNHAQIVSGKE